MMPVVECYQHSFLFFAVFIFLGLFFFLNLVLAIVTNSFSNDTTREMQRHNGKKLFMLADSFAKLVLLMDTGGDEEEGGGGEGKKIDRGERKKIMMELGDGDGGESNHSSGGHKYTNSTTDMFGSWKGATGSNGRPDSGVSCHIIVYPSVLALLFLWDLFVCFFLSLSVS